MDRVCYNCGDKSHISRFCDKKQNYNRCTECNNVCFGRRQHKENCGSKDFRSEYLATNYVAIEPIIGIKLHNVAGISMANGQALENGAHILYASCNGLVKMIDDEFWLNGVPGNNYTISFVDGNGKPRGIFRVNNTLVINDYYNISADGMVKYDPFTNQKTVGKSLCDVKMESNDDVIQMTIKWCGRSFDFNVHRDVMVYIDPIRTKV